MGPHEIPRFSMLDGAAVTIGRGAGPEPELVPPREPAVVDAEIPLAQLQEMLTKGSDSLRGFWDGLEVRNAVRNAAAAASMPDTEATPAPVLPFGLPALPQLPLRRKATDYTEELDKATHAPSFAPLSTPLFLDRVLGDDPNSHQQIPAVSNRDTHRTTYDRSTILVGLCTGTILASIVGSAVIYGFVNSKTSKAAENRGVNSGSNYALDKPFPQTMKSPASQTRPSVSAGPEISATPAPTTPTPLHEAAPTKPMDTIKPFLDNFVNAFVGTAPAELKVDSIAAGNLLKSFDQNPDVTRPDIKTFLKLPRSRFAIIMAESFRRKNIFVGQEANYNPDQQNVIIELIAEVYNRSLTLPDKRSTLNDALAKMGLNQDLKPLNTLPVAPSPGAKLVVAVPTPSPNIVNHKSVVVRAAPIVKASPIASPKVIPKIVIAPAKQSIVTRTVAPTPRPVIAIRPSLAPISRPSLSPISILISHVQPVAVSVNSINMSLPTAVTAPRVSVTPIPNILIPFAPNSLANNYLTAPDKMVRH